MAPTPDSRGRPAPWAAPLALVAAMWLVEILDAISTARLDLYGIRPRTDEGLFGIVAAPFLHGGFGHLLANTGAFVVLGLLVVWTARQFWPVTAGVVLVSGLGVWLVASPNTVHIGASGLVYGYAAFLVAWGAFTRRVRAVLVAVIVVIAYGGLAVGVLPVQPGVSWQGHLLGAVGGVLMARWLSRRSQRAASRL